jgi:hypothetical protein
LPLKIPNSVLLWCFLLSRQCWLFLISPHSASEPSVYCSYIAFNRKHSTFSSFGDEICSCSLWTFTLFLKKRSLSKQSPHSL